MRLLDIAPLKHLNGIAMAVLNFHIITNTKLI